MTTIFPYTSRTGQIKMLLARKEETLNLLLYVCSNLTEYHCMDEQVKKFTRKAAVCETHVVVPAISVHFWDVMGLGSSVFIMQASIVGF